MRGSIVVSLFLLLLLGCRESPRSPYCTERFSDAREDEKHQNAVSPLVWSDWHDHIMMDSLRRHGKRPKDLFDRDAFDKDLAQDSIVRQSDSVLLYDGAALARAIPTLPTDSLLRVADALKNFRRHKEASLLYERILAADPGSGVDLVSREILKVRRRAIEGAMEIAYRTGNDQEVQRRLDALDVETEKGAYGCYPHRYEHDATYWFSHRIQIRAELLEKRQHYDSLIDLLLPIYISEGARTRLIRAIRHKYSPAEIRQELDSALARIEILPRQICGDLPRKYCEYFDNDGKGSICPDRPEISTRARTILFGRVIRILDYDMNRRQWSHTLEDYRTTLHTSRFFAILYCDFF